MQEKDLLRVAIVGSILGLLVLFFLSTFTEIPNASLNELTINDLEKTVKIQGTVTRVLPKESLTIIEVAQHNKMQLVLFEKTSQVQPGDEIEAIGQIEEYNGNLELIADKIIKK